jgi:hypothetical protein
VEESSNFLAWLLHTGTRWMFADRWLPGIFRAKL